MDEHIYTTIKCIQIYKKLYKSTKQLYKAIKHLYQVRIWLFFWASRGVSYTPCCVESKAGAPIYSDPSTRVETKRKNGSQQLKQTSISNREIVCLSVCVIVISSYSLNIIWICSWYILNIVWI